MVGGPGRRAVRRRGHLRGVPHARERPGLGRPRGGGPGRPRHVLPGRSRASAGHLDERGPRLHPLSPDEPVLFVYTACAGGEDSSVGRARAAASAVVAGAGSSPLHRSEGSGSYLAGLPGFAVPGAGGAEPEPTRLPRPGDGPRGSFFGKAVFTGPTLDAAVADALADRIRAAPTQACRIDFQHTGGALAAVDDPATAFWGRTAEWSVPLNAIWDDPADTEACVSWARGTLGALAAHTVGVYNVELRPGLPETAAETRAAYGGNLARLRALRHRYDGAGLLSPLLA